MKGIAVLLLCTLSCFVLAVNSQRAFCIIRNGTVFGLLTFSQEGDSVRVTGLISGLKEGEHGFHVHQRGSLANNCAGAGSHFNPFNQNHGAPVDMDRHVGDLGNIEADYTGNAIVNIRDFMISLTDPITGIIGRAIVVHADPDDLGRGGFSDSRTTGHAGARVGCCVISTGSGNRKSCATQRKSFISYMKGLLQ